MKETITKKEVKRFESIIEEIFYLAEEAMCIMPCVENSHDTYSDEDICRNTIKTRASYGWFGSILTAVGFVPTDGEYCDMNETLTELRNLVNGTHWTQQQKADKPITEDVTDLDDWL